MVVDTIPPHFHVDAPRQAVQTFKHYSLYNVVSIGMTMTRLASFTT